MGILLSTAILKQLVRLNDEFVKLLHCRNLDKEHFRATTVMVSSSAYCSCASLFSKPLPIDFAHTKLSRIRPTVYT